MRGGGECEKEAEAVGEAVAILAMHLARLQAATSKPIWEQDSSRVDDETDTTRQEQTDEVEHAIYRAGHASYFIPHTFVFPTVQKALLAVIGSAR